MDYTNSEILEIAKEANNIILICQNVLTNKVLDTGMFGHLLESTTKIEIALNHMDKTQRAKYGFGE